jgi:NADH-quinone oxidoreductase subunit L
MNLQETDLLRWIILLPLIGAAVNGLVNRSKDVRIAGAIGTLASVAAFVVSLVAISSSGGMAIDRWFTWFEVGTLKVPFHLELSGISTIMLCVVTGIGSLIHIYAIGYMSHEHSPWRFFAYLNLFLAAMLVLVLSTSLVGVFLGWEGVGLCSYLLIGYWFDKDENTAAGMKAFVTNRIGDLGFVIALIAAFAAVGSADVFEINKFATSGAASAAGAELLIICLGIIWAATGKSAQIPLYVWLPDAMAGPTPVSALIHAATMVTSGVVVIARLWPTFVTVPEALDVMLVIGIATAWLAALIALTQRDIKKVLAYSTVSQLGFMFAALGAGSAVGGLFHVVTHACFKALLFLGAGSVIHGMHEKQDLYEMGGLKKHMPLTHATFLVGTLAIIGFPLTSGFFSKDLILAQAYVRSPIAYFMLLGAALLTAFYMLRCYTLAFWGEGRSKEAKHAHESSLLMTVPLVVLAVLSVVVGFFETPPILGGIHAFEHLQAKSWEGLTIANSGAHTLSHFAEWVLVLFTSATSLGIAYVSYKKFISPNAESLTARLSGFSKLSFNKFYIDEVYEGLLIRPLSAVASGLWSFVDRIVINGFLHGLRDTLSVGGQALSLFHTGSLQTYAWYVAVASSVAILLSILFSGAVL